MLRADSDAKAREQVGEEDIVFDLRMTSWGSAGGAYSYDRAAVPEPSTGVLVAAGVAGLAATRRRRVARAA